MKRTYTLYLDYTTEQGLEPETVTVDGRNKAITFDHITLDRFFHNEMKRLGHAMEYCHFYTTSGALVYDLKTGEYWIGCANIDGAYRGYRFKTWGVLLETIGKIFLKVSGRDFPYTTDPIEHVLIEYPPITLLSKYSSPEKKALK